MPQTKTSWMTLHRTGEILTGVPRSARGRKHVPANRTALGFVEGQCGRLAVEGSKPDTSTPAFKGSRHAMNLVLSRPSSFEIVRVGRRVTTVLRLIARSRHCSGKTPERTKGQVVTNRLRRCARMTPDGNSEAVSRGIGSRRARGRLSSQGSRQ